MRIREPTDEELVHIHSTLGTDRPRTTEDANLDLTSTRCVSDPRRVSALNFIPREQLSASERRAHSAEERLHRQTDAHREKSSFRY